MCLINSSVFFNYDYPLFIIIIVSNLISIFFGYGNILEIIYSHNKTILDTSSYHLINFIMTYLFFLNAIELLII